METFGKRLYQLRKKFGLSQIELAKKIGSSKGTIQNYEADSLPKGEYAIKLAQVFNCSIDWLLTGAEPGEKQTSSDDKIIHLDPALQMLKEALKETGAEINEKQKEACLKILREELEKSDTKTKEDIKKYLRAFGK